TTCVSRKSSGLFFISLGMTVYVQVVGAPGNPFEAAQLNPNGTTNIQISWSGPFASHKITYLNVPVTGTTDTTRASAIVPWVTGDFTATGPTADLLKGTAITISTSTSSTSGTTVTADEISKITFQCTLPVKYGIPPSGKTLL